MSVFTAFGTGSSPPPPTPPTLASIVGAVPSLYHIIWDTALNASNTEGWSGTSQPSWSASGASVSLDSVVAPDGNTTAATFTESNNDGNHDIASYTPFLQLTTLGMRCAFIAKAHTRTRIVAQINNNDFGGSNYQASVGFDLVGGNVGYDESTTGFSITNVQMTAITSPASSGWWLCTFDANCTASTNEPQWGVTLFIDAGSGTAARDISYQGDGTSGVYVWWANLLPTPAWNLKQNFFDDFNSASTIDLTNSRQSGFNWYIANSWTDCVMTAYSFNNNPPTVASGLSVSGSLLTWTDVSTTVTNYIYTACPKIGNPAAYNGTVFGFPAMFECRMTWGATPSSGNAHTWPAFWGDTIEGLTGTVAGMLEIDVLEYGAGGPPTCRAISATGPSTINGEIGQVGNSAVPSNANLSVFNVYSGLYINSNAPGANGTGAYLSFFNFVSVQYQPGTFTSASDPELMAQFNSHHFCVILAGGNVQTPPPSNWPTYYDYVKVYN